MLLSLQHLIVSGTWRLSNAMTGSLQTCSWIVFAAAAVFGLDWNTTPPSFLPSCPTVLLYALIFQFFTSLFSPFTLLYSLLFSPCLFLLFLAIYQSLFLILPSPLPSYSQPDRVLLGLCCWQPPNLLHNSTISLPESLLGQASLDGQVIYLAIVS